MNFKASDPCRSRCYSIALEDRNPVLEEASSLIFSGVPVRLLTHQPVPRPLWLCEVHVLLTWARAMHIRALEKPRKAVNLLTQKYYRSLAAQRQRLCVLLSPGEHPAASHTSCSTDPSLHFRFQLPQTTTERALPVSCASMYLLEDPSINIHYCLKHHGRKSPVPKCHASQVPPKQINIPRSTNISQPHTTTHRDLH